MKTRMLPGAVVKSATEIRFAFFVAALLVVSGCLERYASAQSTTATLAGVIQDEQGAVIPGARVTVQNANTALQRQATTDEQGHFAVVLLPPSSYIVSVQSQGFGPVQINNVVLNVGDQKFLRIELKTSAVEAQVQVTTEAPLIDTSPEVSTTIDRQFVGNLPLNGRSFQSLITLTPGVVLTRVGSNDLGQFSVNGQRADANYFTVDGVSANTAMSGTANQGQTLGGTLPSLTVFGGTNNLVSVDALQEFRVSTSTYAPEFGRSPGAQVSIITRSGSNHFHGAFFDYVRNDLFDANDWFANRAKQKKPPLRQNDFGGVFHGPVLLPRFGEGGDQPGYDGHNRTFFFFSYEGLRLKQPQVISLAEVPSINLRQTSLPQIQPYLNAFPIPNGSDLGNGLAQFSTAYSSPATLDAASLRIDHAFNSKLGLFGRYNNAPSETTSRSRSQLSSPRTAAFRTRTLTFGLTLSPTQTTDNDLRINFTENRAGAFLVLDNFGGAVPVSDSALFPPFASPKDSQVAFTLGFGGRPELRVGSTTGSVQRQFNLVDVFSYSVNRHQLKFGLDYRQLRPTFSVSRYFQQALFSNATAVRNSLISQLGLLANRPAEPLFTNLSAFAQDTWRSKQRLTVTFGARWEVNKPPTTSNGNDLFTAEGIENPATITLAPKGTPLYNTRYLNFAPRFGVAYMLSQRPGRSTVFRGGVGVFYDMGTSQTGLGFSLPPFSTGFLAPTPTNVPFPVAESRAQPPPFPNPPFAFVAAFDPDLELPRTYQWNMAVEQSIGAAQTITVSYVAALGRKLISIRRLTNPNPTFQSVQIVRNEAASDYHSLQVQFQRRLSRGVQALASYTWSHSLDDASSDFGFGLDHASSDFDLRHSFSAAITYDLPLSRSQYTRWLLNNWSIDTIWRVQSASPVDLIARSNFNLLGETINVRPDLVLGQPLYINDAVAPGGKRFNKAAFVLPPLGRQGSLGRNVLRGFPVNQTDLSVRRRFSLRENLSVLFRADMFNVFNHPIFADPINLMTDSAFGQSTMMFGRGLGSGTFGAGLSPLYQVGGPRSIQFSLKVEF